MAPPYLRAFRAPILPLILIVLASACGGSGTPSASPTGSLPSAAEPSAEASSEEPTFPVTLTDDDGVQITLDEPPRRIVTFAPSNTEIMFALGLGELLVGVSGPFDNYPPKATEIEQVGGAGEFGVDPNVEKVVSLDPDLLLAIAGGEAWKDRLRELGIPVFTVNATDLDDLLSDILAVGELTGALTQAEALTARMRDQVDEVGSALAGRAEVTCFLEVFYGPPLTTVGPNTFLFDLIDRAGCDPVTASARSDYPSWSLDRLVAESPDVYLVSSESGASLDAVAGRPGFQAIEAVAEGRVYLVDSDLVSRPGPRVVDGLRLVAGALHPEAVDV
jgi:iron complex transport system substrate-binding protein